MFKVSRNNTRILPDIANKLQDCGFVFLLCKKTFILFCKIFLCKKKIKISHYFLEKFSIFKKPLFLIPY